MWGRVQGDRGIALPVANGHNLSGASPGAGSAPLSVKEEIEKYPNAWQSGEVCLPTPLQRSLADYLGIIKIMRRHSQLLHNHEC